MLVFSILGNPWGWVAFFCSIKWFLWFGGSCSDFCGAGNMIRKFVVWDWHHYLLSLWINYQEMLWGVFSEPLLISLFNTKINLQVLVCPSLLSLLFSLSYHFIICLDQYWSSSDIMCWDRSCEGGRSWRSWWYGWFPDWWWRWWRWWVWQGNGSWCWGWGWSWKH